VISWGKYKVGSDSKLKGYHGVPSILEPLNSHATNVVKVVSILSNLHDPASMGDPSE